MQDLETALAEGTWAIAFTPSGKYIGQLRAIEGDEPPKKQYFIEHMTMPVRMAFAQEFHIAIVPQAVQTPEGQQLIFSRRIQAFCVARCLDSERTQVYITPTDYLFFEDMSPGDLNWHKNLVRAGIRAALEARAAESNIVLPGMQTGNA
jgi:hypothetical protein